MKKTYYIVFLLAALLLCGGASTQTLYGQGIDFESPRVEKSGNTLIIQSSMDISRLNMNSRQIAVITPVLRSADGSRSHEFAPSWIVGRNRNNYMRRQEALYGTRPDPIPVEIFIWTRNGEKNIPVTLDVPYEGWMRGAELIFEEHISGCPNKGETEGEYVVMQQVLPPLPAPNFAVAHAAPPAEASGKHSETHTVRLHFPVGRHEIRRNYMSNAAELDQADRTIEEALAANTTITEFRITGYASPEGSAQSNLRLSENRAKAFKDYIVRHHNVSPTIVATDWKGDDWDGLVKLMRESSFPQRQRVIDIVTGTADITARKNALKTMEGYQTLLTEYYPTLRRNEYEIHYEAARPLNIEEGREALRTKPQQLSLSEMYRVANSYPKGSREYNEAMAIAARTYPNDAITRVNNSVRSLESGNWDAAIEALHGIETPEAWNNLGYAYSRKGDSARAADYFKRAAGAGNPTAKANLVLLEEWTAQQ